MATTIIKITDYPHITRENGIELRDKILEVWDKETIILDFDNKTIASVGFFHELICKIPHSVVEIREKINIINMNWFDKSLLNDIIHKDRLY